MLVTIKCPFFPSGEEKKTPTKSCGRDNAAATAHPHPVNRWPSVFGCWWGSASWSAVCPPAPSPQLPLPSTNTAHGELPHRRPPGLPVLRTRRLGALCQPADGSGRDGAWGETGPNSEGNDGGRVGSGARILYTVAMARPSVPVGGAYWVRTRLLPPPLCSPPFSLRRGTEAAPT